MYDVKLLFWVYWPLLVLWWVSYVILLVRLRQKGNLIIESRRKEAEVN